MESIAEALVKIAETEEKVYEAGYLNGYVAGENSISIEIDATLTQEGAAADAKAVGDALLELPHTAPNKDYFHITQEMIENPLESHPYPNNGEYYYKLLDIELDPIVDNLVGTTILSVDEEGNEITEIITDNIYDGRPDGDTSVEICGNEIDLWIVTEDFDMEIYIDEETTETLSVTKGIWMIAYAEELKVKDIEVPCEVANRLDEKYLPKTIVGKNVEGKTFIIEDEEIVAQKGAEIFNDYLNNKATGWNSHAEGSWTTASGNYSHAEGYDTIASGSRSHAEGNYTTASGENSHAEGHQTTALGDYSHAEGNYTKAGIYKQDENGNYLDSNGNITTNESEYVIFGKYSHAEGQYTTASDTASHAEGYDTIAAGTYSHAEGRKTKAINNGSHAEGYNTIAAGGYSHAEGSSTIASGKQSHAEGLSTKATNQCSHAEGLSTTASGYSSHAEGIYTIANGDCQHVQGKYNIADTTSAFIIGNGEDEDNRFNAMTVDWDGNAKFAGDVTTGNGNSINGLTTRIGDIDTALDNIISIQESYLIPNGDEVSY